MEKPKCRICGTNINLLRCSKCKSVYYCSTSHQHADWINHKQECKQKQKRDTQKILTTNTWSNNCDVSDLTSYIGSSASDMLTSPAETISHNSLVNNYNLTDKYENNLVRIKDENLFSSGLSSSSERRNEDLCRNIINDMNTYGLSVVDDFLGMDRGLQILNEVHKMYAAGVFQDGQLVSNSVAERDLRTIRGDKITWVKGTENECANIGYLINQIDSVICMANTMQDNGTLGNYKIRERTKAMVACYPGSGSHYVMHVDNPNRDGRVITAIYYLNINWETKRSGGILRIFPENGGSVADIEPKFDRIIFFWSDRRNPHEVQPAHRTRYAITVWYFDANEREAALNRFKQYRNASSCT